MATPSEPAPGEGPRRLHPLSPVLDLSGLGRALLAPGAVALGAGGLRLLALGVVVVLALQVLAWSRRTYQLAGGVLRIEGGVVVRSQQLLPCERIQQVNLVQKLRHRALGVAVLEVEGAGRESGARLAVLERGRAEALRADLLAAKRGTVGPGAGEATGAGAGAGAGGVGGPEAPEWVPTPWPVVTLGYRQLALAGVTGVELLVFLTVITTAVQFGGDRGWPSLDRFDLRLPGALGAVLVVAGVLAAVALWLGMAVAASILSDGGFRLTLVGDELHVQRGLLDRKEASVPLARVQAVRIDASAPRRALGLVSLRIDSAGAGSGEDDRRVRVPILAAGEVDRVLALVAPGSAPLPTLRSPPPVARRRSVVRHPCRWPCSPPPPPCWPGRWGRWPWSPSGRRWRPGGRPTGGSATPWPATTSSPAPGGSTGAWSRCPWPGCRAPGHAPPPSSAGPAWPPSRSTWPAPAWSPRSGTRRPPWSGSCGRRRCTRRRPATAPSPFLVTPAPQRSRSDHKSGRGRAGRAGGGRA
ncbi:MAG TPA: PH domain-containing protein [Acidimicrobiales bacterium]|nr:PH domain-containing protein [Acidimicrobiales bacterium]